MTRPRRNIAVLRSKEALTAAMTRSGVSRKALAGQVGCSTSWIGHLITGRYDRTTPSRALCIAQAVNAEYRDLFSMPDADGVVTDDEWRCDRCGAVCRSNQLGA